MAILAFPSICVGASTFRLSAPAWEYSRVFGGPTIVKRSGGEHWVGSISYTNLLREDASIVDGWIAEMNPPIGTAYIYNPARRNSQSVTGSPIVSGAGQTGTSLNIVGNTGTFKVGDFFSVNDELKQVTKDLIGDGALEFSPALRTSPAASQAIVYTDAKGIFRIDKDSVDISHHSLFTNISFSITEL